MKSFPVVDKNGTIRWKTDNGWEHREGDRPAVIYPRGGVMYCLFDQVHRADNKPAIIQASGLKQFYVNGLFVKEQAG